MTSLKTITSSEIPFLHDRAIPSVEQVYAALDLAIPTNISKDMVVTSQIYNPVTLEGSNDLDSLSIADSFPGDIKPEVVKSINIDSLSDSTGTSRDFSINEYNYTISEMKYTSSFELTMGRAFPLHSIRSNIERFITHEIKHFRNKLLSLGYLKNFTEIDLKREIAARKKQFPGETIYAFIGEDLLPYYQNIHGGRTFDDAIIIDGGYIYEGYNRKYSWDSAVLAKSQVKSSHSLHSKYRATKGNRHLDIYYAMYLKFSLEIEPRIAPSMYCQQLYMF